MKTIEEQLEEMPVGVFDDLDETLGLEKVNSQNDYLLKENSQIDESK